MIKKIKRFINDRKRKKNPVVFLSLFSYEPIAPEHFHKVRDILGEYGKKHNIEFAIFSNTIVRPIDKKELKQLFDYVYKAKVDKDGKKRRDDIQVL